MRSTQLALIAVVSMVVVGWSQQSQAQSIRLGPGGVEINPRREPPPRVRDELRERLWEARDRCEDGDRRACVRLGIIIGENRERRAEWRRDRPDLFFFER
jgi:hypothetical protein